MVPLRQHKAGTPADGGAGDIGATKHCSRRIYVEKACNEAGASPRPTFTDIIFVHYHNNATAPSAASGNISPSVFDAFGKAEEVFELDDASAVQDGLAGKPAEDLVLIG